MNRSENQCIYNEKVWFDKHWKLSSAQVQAQSFLHFEHIKWFEGNFSMDISKACVNVSS